MTGAQIERARAQERGAKKATLSQRKYEDFVAMLAALTLGLKYSAASSLCSARVLSAAGRRLDM